MSKSYSPPGYVPPEAKNFKFSPNCIFYKNGDKFFPGSRICISNRFRTLDGFKDDLTKTLLKNQECVRNVYTPIGGTKIKTLDDFKDGEHYVASANDKFTPLPYQEISERQRLHHRRKKGFKKIDIEHIIPPVKHASELYQRKSGRARKDGEKNISLRLKVHLNGENHLPAHVINISRNNRKEMTKICEEIENRMNIPPIVKIFKINGDGYAGERDFKPVLDVEELNKEDHLLACHKFKDKAIFCPYPCNGKDDIRVHTSPRLGQEYNYEIFKMAKSVNRKHNRSLNSYRPLPSIGSSKQSEAQSPFSNAGSYGGRKKNPKSRTKQVDYDRDDHGGVYRAKKQNNAYGAQQEEINSKEKTTPIPPGTELNKQPSKETKQDADSQSKKSSQVKKDKKDKKMNNISVLPPIVSDNEQTGDVSQNKDSEKNETSIVKDGHEKDPVKEIDSQTDSAKVDDKSGPVGKLVDQKSGSDMEIEKVQGAVTPSGTKSNKIETKSPSLPTSPNEGKMSQASQTIKERVNEDAGMHNQHHRNDFEDESLNNYDQYTPGNESNNVRSSTPASRGESRRKMREQREYKAATKIQAGARGYQTRKRFRAEKEAMKRDQNEADRRRQEESRRFEEEEEEERRRQADAKQKKAMDEDLAAAKIQASFKGYKTRKEVGLKKQQGLK